MRELIVVEGRGDAEVVRRALGDVEVLWTDGFGLTADKLAYIAGAAAEGGVIVCTDPDHAGETIRAKLERRIPNLRHVYLPQREARGRRGDIGWENASVAAVRAAFARSRTEAETEAEAESGAPLSPGLNATDLLELGLTGVPAARLRRQTIGRALGLGECNAKQFLRRAARFHLTRRQAEEALTKEWGMHG
ncbi:MAG: DUF4093 domain-containing protein [Gracilibacteraceae bacterium]|jgi:ribonuclease M5|nr:DUF4093 domain-containing protein [Gracilibacteraceae bacterium]